MNDKAKSRKITDIFTYYFLCFLTYSVIGWIYEVVLMFKNGYGFVNRGYNFGPWLPIYGFGGLLILVIFYRLLKKWNPIIIFVATSAFAAAVELISTYILDLCNVNFHSLWNYDDDFLNFQGRIALWPSMKFGIIACVVLYLIQPLLDKVYKKDSKIKTVIATVLFVIFMIDTVYHLIHGSNYA